MYYKETLKEITDIIQDTIENELSDDVIEALEILRKDISQTIYEIQNILNVDGEPKEATNLADDYNKSSQKLGDSLINSPMKNIPLNNGNNYNSNLMGSIYLKMKPSLNNMVGTKVWENMVKNDNFTPNNDPLFLSITNKMQNNLTTTIRKMVSGLNRNISSQALEEQINQHIEQFKKELSWYEQNKFAEYDNKTLQLERENRKLLNQVEKLRQRWESLVESARQRRNK